MSQDPKPEAMPPSPPPTAGAAQPAGEGVAAAGAAGGAAEAAAPAPSDARIGELEGQIKDLTDRLLRAHAEMDNMRKRSERERADASKYAITRFAGDIVSVGDNLQRALAAMPASSEGDPSPALKGLLDGVGMTERDFHNVLSRHGVRRIDPKGEAFNPHQHQAVMKQTNTEVASGTVLEVFQVGYMIEDRVLRPAMVVVAEGGFKSVKAPAAGAASANGGTANGGSQER